MALIIRGKSKCPLCGLQLAKSDKLTAFTAFLSAGHELSSFSDAAFHCACFEKAPGARRVSALYEEFKRKQAYSAVRRRHR